MRILVAVAVFLSALLVIQAEQYKVSHVSICDVQNPADCTSDTNDYAWTYGTSQRTGRVNLKYREDGDVDFNVVGEGKDFNNEEYDVTTTVILGKDPSSACKKAEEPATVTFTHNFAECGFSHEFHEDQVRRTNILRVRHSFRPKNNPSSPVRIAGYRDILVSITLHRVNPDDAVVTPCEGETCAVHDKVENCTDFRHQIQASLPPDCNDFLITIRPENYNPDITGVGFKLLQCVVHYGISDVNGHVEYSTLDSPVIRSGRLVQNETIVIRPSMLTYTRIDPGRENIIQWHRLLPRGALHDHVRLECEVCLCAMGPGSSLPQCPQARYFPVSNVRDDL